MLFQQTLCAILRLGSVQSLQTLQVSVTLGGLDLGALEQTLCAIREGTGQSGVTSLAHHELAVILGLGLLGLQNERVLALSASCGLKRNRFQ